jgi:dolichol-phosphate mannosyltransferase
VPVYNETEVAREFYAELCAVIKDLNVPYEIIFVTGGNTDNTLEVLRQLNITNKSAKVINMSARFDYQSALKAGLDYSSGDAVITMDGDLQHPPKLIPDLIREWKNGYDIVYTIRENTRYENIFKIRLKNVLFYFEDFYQA